jgi:hypothetical protein
LVRWHKEVSSLDKIIDQLERSGFYFAGALEGSYNDTPRRGFGFSQAEGCRNGAFAKQAPA